MTILAAPLHHRGLIRISGADCEIFLQGLVSNDITRATEQQAVYAALLTPQGKFLHDLFITRHEGGFLIDCEAARAEDLLRRLRAYKLRAAVTFEDLRDVFSVWAVWGGDYAAPLCSPDPRWTQLGYRLCVAKDAAVANVPITAFEDYDAHRLALGVADGSRDLEIEKSTLAEGNFDYLNGIDWKKGCYVGQELTARMHYRGLAKKRLFPVRINGAVEATLTLVLNGVEVGNLRTHTPSAGLALLTLEASHAAISAHTPLLCGAAEIMPFVPDWMSS